ncbi:unnamed protein product [Durusdinium trenchii]|uniref:Uncharacterized protein n=1 Tax=Durusdinium trenchii TaxID=1381693 RepID=A0ABP0ILJ8_9DINO
MGARMSTTLRCVRQETASRRVRLWTMSNIAMPGRKMVGHLWGLLMLRGAELMQTRARAMSGAAVAATSEAARAKEVFAKHVESVLAKAAKIRAVVQLNADLNVLDGEYNKLSEHVAQGERDDHNQA